VEAYLAFFNLGDVWRQLTRSAFWSEARQFIDHASFDSQAGINPEMLSGLLSREIAIILGEGSADSLRRLVEIGHLNDIANIRSLGLEMPTTTPMQEPSNSAERPPILDAMADILPLLDGWRIPSITLLFRVEDAPAFVRDHRLPELPEDTAMALSSFTGPGGHPFTHLKTTLGRQLDRLDTSLLEQLLGKETTRRLREITLPITGSLAYGALDHSTVAVHLGPDCAALECLPAEPSDSLANSGSLSFINSQPEHELFLLNWTSDKLLDATRGYHPAHPLLQAVSDFLEQNPAVASITDRIVPQLHALMKRAETRHCNPASDHIGIGWRSPVGGIRYEATGGFDYPGMCLHSASRFELPETDSSALSMTWVADLQSRRSTWNFHGDLISVIADTARLLLEQAATGTATHGDEEPLNLVLGMATLLGPTLEALHQALFTLYNEAIGEETFFLIDTDDTLKTVPNKGRASRESVPLPRTVLVHSLEDREALRQAWQQMRPALNNLLGSIPVPGATLRIPEATKTLRERELTWSYSLPTAFGDNLPGVVVNDDFLVLTTATTATELWKSVLIPAPSATRQGHEKPGVETGFRLALNLQSLSGTVVKWLDWARAKQARAANAAAIPIDLERFENALMVARLAAAIGEVRLRIFRDAPGAETRTSLHWSYRDILHTN
jgi:hypothetical protein